MRIKEFIIRWVGVLVCGGGSSVGLVEFARIQFPEDEDSISESARGSPVCGARSEAGNDEHASSVAHERAVR